MRLSAWLFLLLDVFTLPLVAQGRAMHLPPAGPNRPLSVPAGFVITPFGYFHPSCVLEVREDESINKDGLLHHSDGSETQVAPCQYPHFNSSGAKIAAAPGTNENATGPATVEPAIGHSWIEDARATTSSAYGKEVTTWTVPPVPPMHDGQTIFFFPGLEELNDNQTSILQPVIGSYNGGSWTMASWNCCLAGIVVESTPVAINAGDSIVGTSEMTCAAGVTTCATWNVITQDQTTNQATELAATPSDGQTFNFAFAGVLEVYNVTQCLDYPPNASLTLTSQLYDSSLNLISNPGWQPGYASTATQPQCNYAVSVTPAGTALQYGTTAPTFDLGLFPAAGIAVNQGSSATGTLTVTGINGFSGAVDVSLSDPPSGVTAQLVQGAAPGSYTLTLSATSAAAITGANPPATITVTATGSGVATQTVPVNVIVNPPLTGGAGTGVDLSTADNAYAFFNDADLSPALTTADSLDNAGDAYSANQLNPPGVSPMGLNLGDLQFTLGAPDQANAVYGTGLNPIALPAISADELHLLGTGFGGAQPAQPIVVTYTDNSTQTFTQTFDDWSTGPICNSAKVCTPGETVAVTMPYIDTLYAYPREDSIYYLYEYSFALDSGKVLKSVTLPKNRNVVVLAANLANATATPVLSPAAGTINSSQSVTITDATPGAAIYYTTDGSTPAASSTVYSGAITVSSTETVQAIAIASGYLASSVATVSYTFVPPNFAISSTPVTVSPGAGTGNTSTVSLTPSGGFTGAISLSCAITPAAASDSAMCSIPASVTISSAKMQTVTLTISTTPASTALHQPGRFFWPAAGGTTLSCFLLIGLPGRRRRARSILAAMILFSALAGGVLGCKGVSSGSTGSSSQAGNPGTTPGSYVVTVTGTAGTITQTGTFSLTVQ